jgi:hypothetical protein
VNGYGSPYLLDIQVRSRMQDFHREAEQERLAAEATPQGRSLRQRLAKGLYALAARVEGHQSRRATHEGAPLAA